MRWLRRAWAWFKALFGQRPKAWTTEFTDEVPEKPMSAIVYLVGESGHLWFVVFLCPCGCGEVIQLNLLPDTRPRWSVERHTDGTVSLMPSVWRVAGCRSHFFLQHGRIEWCYTTFAGDRS